ncbi:SPFH domain-containing protein [Corynebacterium caspium]|uniref:SPFH domain-containing protein n=1 Tax=Corynebacterium caspium TaxID=234828 RepID=UPI000478052A
MPPQVSVADTPVGHSKANTIVTEKRLPSLGTAGAFIALIVMIAFIGLAIMQLTSTPNPSIMQIITVVLAVVLAALLASGFRVLSPGHTQVAQFFGNYVGTNRRTGLSLVPPLLTTKKISIRVRNFETTTIKVNDANSNPINIGAIIVWQVVDTAKAAFAVEKLDEFISTQAESALRHVATTHPYDGGTSAKPSLSGSTELVSQELAKEVVARVAVAGVEIIEARIASLSYAPEIAQSMLQRQQAAAVVDARETIVEGAVLMVDSALRQLEERDLVELDPERRAAMVSNLLVVLCSDSNAQPVINAGGLYT